MSVHVVDASKARFEMKEIPLYTDLNTIVATGVYVRDANAYVQTLVNCPTQQAFVMVLFNFSGRNGGAFVEVLMDYYGNIYHRVGYNGWGAWRKITTQAITGDMPLPGPEIMDDAAGGGVILHLEPAAASERRCAA